MKQARIILIVLPALIFLTVLFFLWRGLSLKPEVRPSALLGKPAPAFHLTNLLKPNTAFTEQNLKGQVTLLNVWASWCYACEMEHPMLMQIKKTYDIPIYAIVYKDDPKDVLKFLAEMGNPYSMIGNDAQGEVSMDLGVYGTPETFVLNKEGQIVYRHVGMITQELWEKELLPMLQILK